MYALNLDENGRVLSATLEKYAPDDAVKVETLPDGDISNYRYENGTFVNDPLPTIEEPNLAPDLEQRVSNVELDVEQIISGLEALGNG